MKPKPSTLDYRYKLHTENTGKSSSLSPKPTILTSGLGFVKGSRVVPLRSYPDKVSPIWP